jgi:hypothetical protein
MREEATKALRCVPINQTGIEFGSLTGQRPDFPVNEQYVIEIETLAKCGELINLMTWFSCKNTPSGLIFGFDLTIFGNNRKNILLSVALFNSVPVVVELLLGSTNFRDAGVQVFIEKEDLELSAIPTAIFVGSNETCLKFAKGVSSFFGAGIVISRDWFQNGLTPVLVPEPIDLNLTGDTPPWPHAPATIDKTDDFLIAKPTDAAPWLAYSTLGYEIQPEYKLSFSVCNGTDKFGVPNKFIPTNEEGYGSSAPRGIFVDSKSGEVQVSNVKVFNSKNSTECGDTHAKMYIASLTATSAGPNLGDKTCSAVQTAYDRCEKEELDFSEAREKAAKQNQTRFSQTAFSQSIAATTVWEWKFTVIPVPRLLIKRFRWEPTGSHSNSSDWIDAPYSPLKPDNPGYPIGIFQVAVNATFELAPIEKVGA